jgi:hypothetical protein
MQEARREILTRVARGELSPEEGAALLEELERERPGQEAQRQTATPTAPPLFPTPEASNELKRIRVERIFGSLTVVGDPDVREAVAEGPHAAERKGETLLIRSSFDEEGGFMFNWPGTRWPGSRRPWDEVRNFSRELKVRVNPELPLEVLSQAGSVRVRGMHGPISAEIQAGSANIEDFRGPLDLTMQAGALRGSGVLASGSSRIRSEAGSVRLYLEGGSSVRVKAHSTMGRIVLGRQQAEDVFVVGGGSRELTVGSGDASLDIDATMGSVRVETD